MSLITRDLLIQYIKDELNAGVVNLELTDTIIERNLDRSLFFSSDYWNYTSYKTLVITKTSGSSGYVELSEIDPDGIPVVVKVFPTRNVMNIDAALLGLGSVFISTSMPLSSQLTSYTTMLNKLSQLESILGRNARVIGDKLYVDHYWDTITVEYIPQKVAVENINEGSWIKFLIDYTVALCKRQMAQSRGKYVIDSNPAKTNAAELLEQANATIERLEEEVKNKGGFFTTR